MRIVENVLVVFMGTLLVASLGFLTWRIVEGLACIANASYCR